MNRGGISSSFKWIPVALVLLAAALAGSFSSVETPTGALIYQNGYYGSGYGGGFFGSFSFVGFYQQYAPFIDALIFLIIFLSVGKNILGRHFQQGGQTLYIGVGLLLAFALLYWEEETGFHILEKLGPYSIFLLLLVVIVVAFRLLRESGAGALFAIALAYILFYFFFNEISASNAIAQNLYSRFQNIQELLDTLFYISIASLIAGIFFLAIRTWTTRGQNLHDFLQGRRGHP